MFTYKYNLYMILNDYPMRPTPIRHHLSRRLILALPAALALPMPVLAQDYPTKPVQIVVPTVPGGGTDFVARYLAQRLSPALSQSVIIENRSGADGNIGVEYVAKSRPDGYALVIPITSFPTNPSLYPDLPFDTVKDFDGITLLAKAPLVLVVNAKVPASNLKELIAFAKQNPGKINFAQSGNGTTANLAGQLFKRQADIDIVPIGYRGGAQIMIDLIAGHVQMYFSTLPTALPHIAAGTLRPIAVTSPQRLPELPAVATMSESLSGFDVQGWFGLFAPAGTPKEAIKRLNVEVTRILSLQETKDAFAKEGLIVTSSSPEELHTFLVSDIARWRKIIEEAGIKRE